MCWQKLENCVLPFLKESDPKVKREALYIIIIWLNTRVTFTNTHMKYEFWDVV